MSFNKIRKIPSPDEIINKVPMTQNLKTIKKQRDDELKSIIEGIGHKFIIIIGPCSADEESSVCDYVYRLAIINEKVKEKLFVIPRVYTNKPRTTGEGYKGMLHQPHPEEAGNMLDGILSIRKMHARVISESGLTAADEMLYTDNLDYCQDMLSYIAIGARSTEDQQHRLTASGIDLPVGMKNPTSGDLSVMFNSIQAAQAGHSFIYQGNEVQTSGNLLAHAVMRGSVNKHGVNIPNYHYEDLITAIEIYKKRELKFPTLIVDVNHSNSAKKFFEQPRITKEVLHSRKCNTEIKNIVKGLMIESYLVEGNQKIGEGIYGKSITDACLGWHDTEELIYYIAENI